MIAKELKELLQAVPNNWEIVVRENEAIDTQFLNVLGDAEHHQLVIEYPQNDRAPKSDSNPAH